MSIPELPPPPDITKWDYILAVLLTIITLGLTYWGIINAPPS